MSFVFYDTETTGLSIGFDQIVHFAAIRTDADLNPTARFEVRSRLLPYVTPHPGALRTNGLPIAELNHARHPSHFEMVAQVRACLRAWSPALFVGFNSIRFDEELLRQAFFQSLLPPYLTTSHGNGRTDALNLALAAAAVTPACLEVPLGPNGRRTFRLDQLATANGLVRGRAHDAMVDAETTLELCRRVRERAPDVWQRFVRFSTKAAVAAFLDGEDAVILSEFFANEAYHAPVADLGPDPRQANVRLCLHLREDPAELASISDDELRARLAGKPSPIRRVRTNAAPAVAAVYDFPEPLLEGVDVTAAEAWGRQVRADPALCARLVRLYAEERDEYPAAVHVEKQIYARFPSPDDERRMEAFHAAGWRERPAIVESFDDARLRRFGRRILHAEHRSLLTEGVCAEADRDVTDRLADEAAGGLTLVEAMRETALLMADAQGDPNGVLADYHAFLGARLERVTAFRREALGV